MAAVSIHCYGEHARLAGRICHDAQSAGDDAFLWCPGSVYDLIRNAEADIAYHAPRGAAGSFRVRCARAVLAAIVGDG